MIKLSKKQKITIISAISIMIVIVILILCFSNSKIMINRALSSDRYNRLQMKISQTITSSPIKNDEGFLAESIDSDSEGEYSEYANQGDFSADNTNTDADTTQVEVCTLNKDGSIIYEYSSTGKTYYYIRDGKDYVLYYDKGISIEEENGQWVETSLEDFGLKPSFDFSVLNDIKDSNLIKANDGYAPQNNEQELFYSVLCVVDKNKYSNCSIRFYFEKSSMIKIVAKYTFNNNIDIEQVYDISYEDESIAVPEADVKK